MIPVKRQLSPKGRWPAQPADLKKGVQSLLLGREPTHRASGFGFEYIRKDLQTVAENFQRAGLPKDFLP